MISDYSNLSRIIRTLQSQGKIVVLVTGVFDLLHIEHLRLFAAAKAAGDVLVVGVETDTRVRQLKGGDRPINIEAIRLEQLDHLKHVDYAFLLPGQFSRQSDWEGFMDHLKPDVYAVSAHSGYLENKQAICDKYGIQLRIVRPHNPDYSTSRLAAAVSAATKE